MSETDEVKAISWDMLAEKNDLIATQAAQIEALRTALLVAREVLDCGGARHVYGSVDKAVALIAKIDAALSNTGKP